MLFVFAAARIVALRGEAVGRQAGLWAALALATTGPDEAGVAVAAATSVAIAV